MTLRIVVTARHVPDDDGADSPLPELDEYAVGQALRMAETHERAAGGSDFGPRPSSGSTQVTVVTVGPRATPRTLRKVLSMGADRVVHVVDDDPYGTDALGTSLMLARAVRRVGYDLLVAGMARADGTPGVVSALLAEHLGVPRLSRLSRLSEARVENGCVRGGHAGADTAVRPWARLPAVVSLAAEGCPAPGATGRRPAAQRLESWSLSDLGLDAPAGTLTASLAAAWSHPYPLFPLPPLPPLPLVPLVPAREAGGAAGWDEGAGACVLPESLMHRKAG